VAGQQHGGSVAGIGQALYEDVAYDPDGTPRAATFADYLLASAADVPAIDTETVGIATPVAPNGAKGIGENGAIAAPSAVQIAVIDALAPGSDWQTLVEWTIQQDAARVAWVGHAPCVGRLVALSIGDGNAAIRMTKGAVASIRLDDGLGQSGELEWLATAPLFGL